MRKRPIHLDCTLRDGGYYTDWDFSDEFVKNYLEAAKSACINYIEIGFRFFYNKGFKGAYAFSKEDFLNTIEIPKELSLSIMINGKDLISKQQLVLERIDDLVPVEAKNSKVNLIRVACELDELKLLIPALNKIKDKGYLTGVNIMKITQLNNNQLSNIGIIASKSKVDVLYFADSLGALEPDQIKNIINCLKKDWKGEIGIHAHDNKGLALRNTLQAVQEGVSWVDSTVTGMGRGAGNTRTEDLIIELDSNQKNISNLIPLLKIINKTFNPIKKKFSWGSNPYYYLAAKYSIHPSYIQNLLSDDRLREEDILGAIQYFSNEESTIYSSDQLESAKNFYHGQPTGSICPAEIIKNRDVLILGSGEKLDAHLNALESFIKRNKPLVIAMNAKSKINNNLINLRIASNPIRLMADVDMHLKLPQKLITPSSMLPKYLSNKLSKKDLLDYGIGFSKDRFEFHKKFGIIPSQLVFAYALSFVVSGNAKRIFLAGFSGFGLGDPRNQEINELIEKLYKARPNVNLIAITPTEYVGLKSISIYGI